MVVRTILTFKTPSFSMIAGITQKVFHDTMIVYRIDYSALNFLYLS